MKKILFIIFIILLSGFVNAVDLETSIQPTNVFKEEDTSVYNEITKTNGTNNGADCSVAGIDGNACDFELSELDYQFATLATTTVNNKATISCWLKPESFAISYIAIGTQASGTRYEPRMGIISGAWDFITSGSDGANTGGTPDANWHNLIGVLDGLNKRLYLDGVSLDNLTSGNLGNIGTDWAFGTWDASSDNWDGLIDECYTWNYSIDEPDGSTYDTSLVIELQTTFYPFIENLSINISTYNMTSDGGCIDWRTNQSTNCNTTDGTPTFTFETNRNADCSVRATQVNTSSFPAYDSNFACGTTGGTTHICTTYYDDRLVFGQNYLYASCTNGGNATSGALAINMTAGSGGNQTLISCISQIGDNCAVNIADDCASFIEI